MKDFIFDTEIVISTLIGIILLGIVIRFSIRSYFKEKRRHLVEMSNINDIYDDKKEN